MDTPPATPQAAPANLTINAPSTPRVEQSDLAPPSPTSLCSSGLADARASTSPAAVAHPGLSPAWETKEGYEHQQRRQFAGSGAAAAAGTTPSAAALTISAPTTSADPSTPVAADAAGPRPFSSTNLRPDLVPPRRETMAQPSSQVAAPVPGPAAAPAAQAAPSPSGIDVGSASETVERPGFFRSSTDTAASLPPSDAGVTAHVEPPLPEAAAETTSSSTVRPPSSQSGISGVFELDLDSPLATSTTPPVDDMGTQDFARRNVGDPEDLVVVSRDPSAEEVTAGAAQSISAAPVPSLPWGRVAPSPDSSQPLPGPWGRLQEVMDEIKVMSPASPTSRVPHPFLSGARPSSTPGAEERKGFARTSSPLLMSTRGRIAGSSSSSASASASSRIADSRQQPRQQEEKQQHQHQHQQQQQPVPRSLSPSSSPRQVTSPPTTAASAANTPCETPTTAVQQPVAPASSLPSSRHLAAVEEQSQQSASSPRASSVARRIRIEPGVDTKQEREEGTPHVPVPGWALGFSTSPFSSAATGPRGAGDEVAAAAAPTETAAAGSGSGAAPVGTASHDVSDQAGEVLEDLRGDDTAEDPVNVRAVLPVEDDAATGGRGYVGQRFIQAAEAVSESPQLRRAAGAAATAVSAAAGTARVQFTYTSRTIGKILVASAKSFEEFVDEQLQEDGSGQVLRREGGTGLLVPRGKQLSQAFIVTPGCCLCWEFRVKDYDLGFALRRRFQGMGGSTEEDIFELKRYSSGETFQGRWTADSDSNAPAVVIMVWDNSYSCLRPKTLAYKAQVNRPGIDPAAPPPAPPPTPAAMSAAQPPVAFGGGVGSVGGAEDTEAFAIDESEGEETSAYSAGVGTYRAGVAIAGGGSGGGEEEARGEGKKGGVDASATTTSRRQGANPTIRGKGAGEGEGEGERERGRGGPKTVNIEDFLAMPETGSGDGGSGDRDGAADDDDSASK